MSLGAATKGHADTSSRPKASGGPKVEDGWQIAADGEKVRTEQGFRQLLLDHGYQVRKSDTHGMNNCLIDSLLQTLSYAKLAKADLSVPLRKEICGRVRNHLAKHHGATMGGYLAHDDHMRQMFEFLRVHEANIWREDVRPGHVELTVTVFDRFTCRAELAPHDPVLIPPDAEAVLSHAVRYEQVHLYACTHSDGAGYHYEWIHGV